MKRPDHPPTVVLYQPEIPPNTGNIARTCAAVGAPLHLIKPLGFSIEDRMVRRAGLDYWSSLDLTVHEDWECFLRAEEVTEPALITTKGRQAYTTIEEPTDSSPLYLIFGPETRGLPPEILDRWPGRRYRIPMRPGLRSLNVANSVAIVLYDRLARCEFQGLT